MNILISKTDALEMGPRNKIAIFSRNGYNDFY
jgi:hypothetical protein